MPGLAHLLDATIFWNPSGGVRRYIVAKRLCLRQQAGWRHTLAAPHAPAEASERADTDAGITICGLPLPAAAVPTACHGGAQRTRVR